MAERTVYVDDALHKGIGYRVRCFDSGSPHPPLECVGLETILLDNHQVLFMSGKKENANLPNAPLRVAGPFGVAHNIEEAYKKLQNETREIANEMAKTYKTDKIEDRTAEKILSKK